MPINSCDVRSELTIEGPTNRRTLRLTHAPTGVSVEAEGEHVSARALRRRLKPDLEAAVNRAPERLRRNEDGGAHPTVDAPGSRSRPSVRAGGRPDRRRGAR